MMIFHMTSSTQNNQIKKFIIFSVIIYMMCIKFVFSKTDSTMIRQFSQSKTPIRKFSFAKVRVFFSQFIFTSDSRIIIANLRTKFAFSSPSKTQKIIFAMITNFKFIWISTFVRTAKGAELSFFCRMMRKFFIAYFAKSDSMMIEVIARSRAIKSYAAMIARNGFNFFTKFTGVFHFKLLYTLNGSYTTINQLTVR